jgi:transposase
MEIIMRIETILNRCCKFKSFTFKKVIFSDNGKNIIVSIKPRKNSHPICSQCKTESPGYDKQSLRLFEFIPFWGFSVYFQYAMRRVQCLKCNKVVVEKVPWAEGKNHLTYFYIKYLSGWAKEMAWQTVASRFRTSWQTVHRSVQSIVKHGLEHRSIEDVTALGIDEVQWHKGHKYMTLVYQIDKGNRRLLWVGKDRTKKTLRKFFTDMWHKDRKFRRNIKVVCTDMWQAYLHVVKEKVPDAVNVLDKFHIMQKIGKSLDAVRAQEVKRLKKEGNEVILKHSRWCFLKRKFNLTKPQRGKLKELVNLNLNIVKAYILKEQFHKFWEYKSPTWAGKFLDNWCELVLEAELEPMTKITTMLQKHRTLILNYFITNKEFNSGIVEGLNRKVNLTVRKAFGFRSFEVMETALYHQLGNLPEPTFPHEFW